MCDRCRFESDYWDLQDMLKEFRKKRTEKNEEAKRKSNKETNK